MIRTYWASKGQDWEFLGAFTAGHKAQADSPQGKGAALDITDQTIPGLLDQLAGRVKLVGFPNNWARRMKLKMPLALKWAEISGYVK